MFSEGGVWQTLGEVETQHGDFPIWRNLREPKVNYAQSCDIGSIIIAGRK